MSEERRLVEVQLQQWYPRLLTVVVSVPADWTDEQLKSKLSKIYEEVDLSSDNWTDQVDYDPREGDHEVTGEPSLTSRPDLVYPADTNEEEDDE